MRNDVDKMSTSFRVPGDRVFVYGRVWPYLAIFGPGPARVPQKETSPEQFLSEHVRAPHLSLERVLEPLEAFEARLLELAGSFLPPEAFEAPTEPANPQ